MRFARISLLLCLALLLFPSIAQGAIGVTEGAAEIVSTSQASTYAFGSFTPATNNVIVIIAFGRGTVDDGAITNTSGTSLTWARKTSAVFNTVDTVYIFWAKTSASTVASVYTVDFTGDAATGCIAYMFQFSGADLNAADPLKQAITNSATSTNATGTFGTALDTVNGYAAGWMGALSSSNPANVSTPPSSWTEVGDNGFATPTSNGSGAFRAGGETGTTATFTNSSTTWGYAAVEVSAEPPAVADSGYPYVGGAYYPVGAAAAGGGGGSFPVNSVLDNFNRANEGPPPSASWAGSIDGVAGCSVVSNQLKCASDGTAYWGTTFGPDCEAYLTTLNAGSFSSDWAVFGRIASPGASFTGYRVYAQASTNLVYIQRIDAGSPTTLGASISQTIIDGDSFGIEIIGTTIKAYYRVGAGAWTEIGSRSDSTYSAAGYIGVLSGFSGLTADDFGGGTIP